MNPNEYLSRILDEQTLTEDGAELNELRDRRKEVEALLREAFGASPTIRYGGSKAKGTMIKEAYDLDIICYFPRDDEDAGGTLEAIYDNVKATLSKNYLVIPKASAIRLQSRGYQDFHVDVVPGRFVDDKQADTFLHQTSGEKARLKTNLDVHIEHVKGSGVVPAIRLAKLWRIRRKLSIRHFGLELLVIEALKAHKSATLEAQVRRLLVTLRDDVASLKIEDPANPTGNDLTELLSDSVRNELATAAREALSAIERDGWESLFGKLAAAPEKKAALVEAVRAVAPTSAVSSRPWRRG